MSFHAQPYNTDELMGWLLFASILGIGSIWIGVYRLYLPAMLLVTVCEYLLSEKMHIETFALTRHTRNLLICKSLSFMTTCVWFYFFMNSPNVLLASSAQALFVLASTMLITVFLVLTIHVVARIELYSMIKTETSEEARIR